MKQFFRNFQRQKAIGILNTSSLSLGIMVALVVGLWAMNELRFDKFHENKEHIYRVVLTLDMNGKAQKTSTIVSSVGERAADNIPQISEVCRIINATYDDIRIAEQLYPNVRISSADPNLFTLFSFRLKEGDATSVLKERNNVVLSESAARKYFPDKNPMGQALSLLGQTFTVSGIMEDMPVYSSIDLDIIVPTEVVKQRMGTSTIFMTFLRIPHADDIAAISANIEDIYCDIWGDNYSGQFDIELEPLDEIHFSTGFLSDRVARKGNRSLTLIFIIIAFVILIIACINFTNLFISTSFMRARTVGIKKSLGAGKAALLRVFYGETALYTLIAIAFGVLSAYMVLPVFNSYTRSEVIIDPTTPELYLFAGALFVFTVLAAGTFPAFYLTQFNPMETIFGRFKGAKVSLFQKVLLIVQFTASIALLMVVTFMYRQVDYMIGQDLGFDKENVIYVQERGGFGRNFYQFRDEMMRNPAIINVTKKSSLPNVWMNDRGVQKERMSRENILMEICSVQKDYFEFMDLDIIMGENPFHLESTDSILPIVINEQGVNELQLEGNPVGQVIYMSGKPIEIKGVMKNAQLYSFHHEMHPQVYVKLEEWQYGVFFFKITGDPQSALATIQQEWERCNPEYPFEYHFLDETYEQQYKAETNAGRVLAFAMMITFLISIAGLFAMAYYSTQRRIREIGLRKVNGATTKDLLLLLNKDFLVWTLISYVIALPVSVVSLHQWLQSFTVRTPLSIWVFLLIGVGAFCITLLTTSMQTWKVANTNPVKTLKVE